MKSTAIKLLQALLLVLTVTGADLQAQSEELEFTPEEQAWINANPIIQVGGETDWAPFDFADAEGRHTGIVADYLDLVSARTGLQFEVRLDSFANLMSAMDSGDIDLLPAIYFSEERASRHTLTSKYHQVRNYVFARDDVDVDRTLSGKTVAMVKGFSPSSQPSRRPIRMSSSWNWIRSTKRLMPLLPAGRLPVRCPGGAQLST